MSTFRANNQLGRDPGNSHLEPRKMMMATPTFTGDLPADTDDPSFSDVVSGTPKAISDTAQASLRQAVARNEIDDRGSEISVKNSDFETTDIGKRSPISDSNLRWHNPFDNDSGNAANSSRWYQRDGNTQIFRVFPGDQNWFGDREGAARSEVFVKNRDLRTIVGDGFKTNFSARFHVAQHNGSNDVMLFQSKGSGINTSGSGPREPAWGVALFVEKDGDIVVKNRSSFSRPLDTNKDVGDSFDFEVEDNGKDYTVYIDGDEFTSGTWDRGNTPTTARWGAYVQRDGSRVGSLLGTQEQIVYVSGAQVTRTADPTDV